MNESLADGHSLIVSCLPAKIPRYFPSLHSIAVCLVAIGYFPKITIDIPIAWGLPLSIAGATDFFSLQLDLSPHHMPDYSISSLYILHSAPL